jgi:hypothetical protein
MTVVYCQNASSLLGKVTLMLHEAECTTSFDPRAEFEYDQGIEAFAESRYQDASAHLAAARKNLNKDPAPDLSPVSGP